MDDLTFAGFSMEIEPNWIKSLVHQENQLENTGEVSLQSFKSTTTGSEEELKEHSVEFLKQMRLAFTQSVSFFNQLKGYMGTIRIYGITGAEGDFMLFRNGYKLIFSLKSPGIISIRFLNIESLVPNKEDTVSSPADYLKGVWGSFGELKWTHNNQPIRLDFLIRHYMTHFVKQSIR